MLEAVRKRPSAVSLEAHYVVVATGARHVGPREAFVVVDLAIAVGVVQPGDLVAAEHMDGAVDNQQAQRLMQAGGDPPPREAGERVVDAVNSPDISLHCADHKAAVGQEVVAAAVEQGVPGVVVGQGEGVDGKGGRGAKLALGVDHLWPLWWPASGEVFERMLRQRGPLPHKLAVDHLRHIEIPHAIETVEEAHLRSRPAEALVDGVGCLR